jgi:hypothetical protein
MAASRFSGGFGTGADVQVTHRPAAGWVFWVNNKDGVPYSLVYCTLLRYLPRSGLQPSVPARSDGGEKASSQGRCTQVPCAALSIGSMPTASCHHR